MPKSKSIAVIQQCLSEDAIAKYMTFYPTKRMQSRFDRKVPAEVRVNALTMEAPKENPIPENQRIQKYKAQLRPEESNCHHCGSSCWQNYLLLSPGLPDKGRFKKWRGGEVY